jgi:hypothetical protein
VILPIRLQDGKLTGATWPEVRPFYYGDTIRQIERASIRTFMETHRAYLKGRVLDFGCGKQPYRDLVEGEYIGINEGDLLPEGLFDVVMLNQVSQYLRDPAGTFKGFARRLRSGGHLVTTWATNWEEIEDADLFRFTLSGMRRVLEDAGFELKAIARRAEVMVGNFKFVLGYGCIAQKRS